MLIYNTFKKILGFIIYFAIVLIHLVIFSLLMWYLNMPFNTFYENITKTCGYFGNITLIFNITLWTVITFYFGIWYKIIIKLTAPYVANFLLNNLEKHFELNKHLFIEEN